MLLEILEAIGEILFTVHSSSESSNKHIRSQNRICNCIFILGLVISCILLPISVDDSSGRFIGLSFAFTLLAVLLSLFALIKLDVVKPLTLVNFFKISLGILTVTAMLIVWLYK